MSGEDVGRCTRCGRWQRRRHAYAEEFAPGDREEWCVTGGCIATWNQGVELVVAAEHDDSLACRCALCLPSSINVAAMERAADQGMTRLPA